MNSNYHIHVTSIMCPYCDAAYEDDDYSVENEIETQIECECDACGKKFHAEATVVFNTNSDCNLNDLEHEWETSETHPTVFNCKNCCQYEVRTIAESESK
jgi:hypothetical protein